MIIKRGRISKDVWKCLETQDMQPDNHISNIDITDLSVTNYYEQIKVLFDVLPNIEEIVLKKIFVTYLFDGHGKKTKVKGIISH